MVLPIILVSLSAHEFAHGYIARRLGDHTAEYAGRLTLNPLAHLDPIGTIMLIFSSLIGFGFGWAKPVPVNPRYFHNPARGMFQVALAGPLTNLALAAIFGLSIRFSNWQYLSPGVQLLLLLGVMINLGLFLFNLIPVPPLDGSKVLAYFLHGRAYGNYLRLQQYGFLILLLLVATRLSRLILDRPLELIFRLLTGGYPWQF